MFINIFSLCFIKKLQTTKTEITTTARTHTPKIKLKYISSNAGTTLGKVNSIKNVARFQLVNQL